MHKLLSMNPKKKGLFEKLSLKRTEIFDIMSLQVENCTEKNCSETSMKEFKTNIWIVLDYEKNK